MKNFLTETTYDTKLVKREPIIGSRRLENYIWASVLLTGGLGFTLASLSSYFKKPFFPFNAAAMEINFIPQGILMAVYGILGIGFSVSIMFNILWDIGAGYNEFDKINETVRIVRRGFPGKNKNILLNYNLNEIKAIEVEILEGISPRRTIYLVLTDKRRIPLTGVGQPLTLTQIEEKGITLAKFLEIDYTIDRW